MGVIREHGLAVDACAVDLRSERGDRLTDWQAAHEAKE